jgi:hypothetical protein
MAKGTLLPGWATVRKPEAASPIAPRSSSDASGIGSTSAAKAFELKDKLSAPDACKAAMAVQETLQGEMRPDKPTSTRLPCYKA